MHTATDSIPDTSPASEGDTGAADRTAPLLYARRKAVELDPRLGTTTTCQTTMASDWTPDD